MKPLGGLIILYFPLKLRKGQFNQWSENTKDNIILCPIKGEITFILLLYTYYVNNYQSLCYIH